MRGLLVVMALCLPAVSFADPAAAAAELDALYAERHLPEKLKALRTLTEDALKAHPTDYGTLWRAARTFFWLSEADPANEDRAAAGRRAWELGDRAIKIDPKRVEGHYYAAVGIGAYSLAVGIVTALTQGLEGKFNERLDKAIELNASFNNAGPLIAKGRYHFTLPWPKRDLGRSAQLLQKAIEAVPGALRAHLYLAETQLKAGEPKKARDTLNKVFAGDEAYDVAEARRVKQLARAVKAQIDEELNR